MLEAELVALIACCNTESSFKRLLFIGTVVGVIGYSKRRWLAQALQVRALSAQQFLELMELAFRSHQVLEMRHQRFPAGSVGIIGRFLLGVFLRAPLQ